jgi:hypothetical protein
VPLLIALAPLVEERVDFGRCKGHRRATPSPDAEFGERAEVFLPGACGALLAMEIPAERCYQLVGSTRGR